MGGRGNLGGIHGLGEGCSVGTEYWITEELHCQRESGRQRIIYIYIYSLNGLCSLIVGQDRLDLDER
jgi:hypothetical protein